MFHDINSYMYCILYFSIIQDKLDISEKVSISVGSADLEVKVQGKKPWYVTHRLDNIHPHTKYQKLTSKDKKISRSDIILDGQTD